MYMNTQYILLNLIGIIYFFKEYQLYHNDPRNDNRIQCLLPFVLAVERKGTLCTEYVFACFFLSFEHTKY